MITSKDNLFLYKTVLFCCFLLLMTTASPLFAGAEGRISAVIIDQDGEPLKDALVTLSNESKGFEDQTKTNKKGRARFALVDATEGGWTILIEKEGYQPIQFSISPVVGGTMKAEWTLTKLQPVEEIKMEGLEEMSMEEGNKAIAIFNEGATAYGEGNVDAAIAKFEEALVIAPELAQARSALVQIRSDRGEYALAAEEAAKLLEIKPGDLLALQVRYDSFAALNDRAQAQAALEVLIAADPSIETAKRAFNEGAAVLRSGDQEGGKAWFKRCLEINPGVVPAHSALANMALTHNDFDTALQHADQIQAMDANNVDALAIRYEALRGKGDEAGAKATFDQIQALDPALAGEAFFKQGVALFNQGNNEAAATAFGRSLTANPDHPRAHYMLGLVNLNNGNTAEAKRYLDRFIELAPNDPDVATAREMLGFLE